MEETQRNKGIGSAKGKQEREKGCASLWSRSKSRWYPGREGKTERRRKHTHRRCLCMYTHRRVRPVKRKGSDQRRDEAVEEARGRHREEWEVQSEPQGLCAHSNFIVLCTIFMGMVFFHDLFLFFAWQMHAHTHTHTNKLPPPLIPALHLRNREALQP